jgi:hypothetical protein
MFTAGGGAEAVVRLNYCFTSFGGVLRIVTTSGYCERSYETSYSRGQMRRATIVTLAIICSLSLGTSVLAAAPYGSCPEKAQVYQERFESSGQVQDMVCMQKALEREMTEGPSYSCLDSAQSYQTAYEKSGRASDLVCMQEALKRELQ